MQEKLTAQQAREVPLSLNPVRRFRQVRAYEESLIGLPNFSSGVWLRTRGHLVRMAIESEQLSETMQTPNSLDTPNIQHIEGEITSGEDF